jgi:uncharacterized protein YjbJ (UPF0337 family)
MNSEQLHGHLRSVKGWAIEHWGRVTDDPWMRIAGRREQLLGNLQASLARSRRLAVASFPARPPAFSERRRFPSP